MTWRRGSDDRANTLWQLWTSARANDHLLEARAHAETLLEMLYQEKFPHWNTRERTTFLNWAEEFKLIRRSK
jgi:hypothetical protein